MPAAVGRIVVHLVVLPVVGSSFVALVVALVVGSFGFVVAVGSVALGWTFGFGQTFGSAAAAAAAVRTVASFGPSFLVAAAAVG